MNFYNNLSHPNAFNRGVDFLMLKNTPSDRISKFANLISDPILKEKIIELAIELAKSDSQLSLKLQHCKNATDDLKTVLNEKSKIASSELEQLKDKQNNKSGFKQKLNDNNKFNFKNQLTDFIKLLRTIINALDAGASYNEGVEVFILKTCSKTEGCLGFKIDDFESLQEGFELMVKHLKDNIDIISSDYSDKEEQLKSIKEDFILISINLQTYNHIHFNKDIKSYKTEGECHTIGYSYGIPRNNVDTIKYQFIIEDYPIYVHKEQFRNKFFLYKLDKNYSLIKLEL